MDIVPFLKQKVEETQSYSKVARKTGVSQGTISKILSGDTKPSLETITKIAKAYGLPVAALLGTDSVADQAAFSDHTETTVIRGKVADPIESYVIDGVPLSQMSLEQKLVWIGLGVKDIRQVQEWKKLSEEEQDEELKRLCFQNIEKGRF